MAAFRLPTPQRTGPSPWIVYAIDPPLDVTPSFGMRFASRRSLVPDRPVQSVYGSTKPEISSAACSGSQSTEPVPPAEVNQAPVAVAGFDQMATTGSSVELDGTHSSDPNGDNLRFGWSMWSRPAGSDAVLQDSTSTTPSFMADVDGQYLISLVVDDDWLASVPDTVAVLAVSPEPACVSDPSPTFTRHITDLGQLEVIVPPGSLSGDHISSHFLSRPRAAGQRACLCAGRRAHGERCPLP